MIVSPRRLSYSLSFLMGMSLLSGCTGLTSHDHDHASHADAGVSSPALLGTHWSFSTTDSQEEAANFLLQPPSVEQLAEEDDDRLRLVGSNGCNRLMGPVVLDESRQTMDIGPLASTMKMCPNSEQANAFNRMLEEVASYEVIGAGESARLKVMDDTGYLLATFMPMQDSTE